MLKTFPMVEEGGLEISLMPVLQGKIKVLLCHEAVSQENLQTGKKIPRDREQVNGLDFNR